MTERLVYRGKNITQLLVIGIICIVPLGFYGLLRVAIRIGRRPIEAVKHGFPGRSS